jgi:hypothetical protein
MFTGESVFRSRALTLAENILRSLKSDMTMRIYAVDMEKCSSKA